MACLLGELNLAGRAWAAAGIATDGVDYIEEAAGAVIDQQSLAGFQENNTDINGHIENFDTYNLFKQGPHLINTGYTGTNVCDIMVYYLPR
jgi:glycerate-2-kinase